MRLPLICFLLVFVGLGCKGRGSENPPPTPRVTDAASTIAAGSGMLFSLARENDCFIYRIADGKAHRITKATHGCERWPTMSPDGKSIAYGFAEQVGGPSTLILMNADGTGARKLFGNDEDGSNPVFSHDGSKIYFIRSEFFGNHSPIVRPARHKLDLYSSTLDGKNVMRMTHQAFYEILSLSVAADDSRFTLSTSRYPLGSVVETYYPDNFQAAHYTYQPHVPDEPSHSPAFGDAMTVPNLLQDILLVAANDKAGGNFDYDLYLMSSVTGEIKKLTNHHGMIDSVTVSKDGSVAVFTGPVGANMFDMQTGISRSVPIE